MTSIMDDLLLVSEGPVASVTFNRPEIANAMAPSWIIRLRDFFEGLEAREDIRCVVIRGNGKHFFAGAEIGPTARILQTPAAERFAILRDTIVGWNRMIMAITRLKQPVIASTQGGVAGAAVGLIAACDLVIASDDAFFFIPQVNLGASVDGMSSYFLPRQIGLKKAMGMMLLGQRIKAAEAERMGLINLVVPGAELAAETDRLVDQLACGASAAHGLIKQLIQRSLSNSIQQQGDLEIENYAAAAMTDDFEEGMRAFLEKRQPSFVGR